MLKTPIGDVKIYLDDIEVDFQMEQIYNKKFPDVTTFHLKYKYNHDKKKHTLKCVLCDTKLEGEMEPGERLESISFESIDPCVRLSIGVGKEFAYYADEKHRVVLFYEDAGTNYIGDYLSNGLEIYIVNGDVQEYRFSVAWMYDYTDENSHKTWCMADPAYPKD